MYDFAIATNKKEKFRSNLRSERRHRAFVHGLNPDNQDFTCAHCHKPASALRLLAGVDNRNHCPYCLASRHVDWQKPGDRLSACKQVMPAVALTFKRTNKKYRPSLGELMLVHVCQECGKVSANRIAADDDPDKLWQIFESSATMDQGLRLMIESAGVCPVEVNDRQLVQSQLFGFQPASAEEMVCNYWQK